MLTSWPWFEFTFPNKSLQYIFFFSGLSILFPETRMADHPFSQTSRSVSIARAIQPISWSRTVVSHSSNKPRGITPLTIFFTDKQYHQLIELPPSAHSATHRCSNLPGRLHIGGDVCWWGLSMCCSPYCKFVYVTLNEVLKWVACSNVHLQSILPMHRMYAHG